MTTRDPGASEVWYSGIDEPCDGGNDYDQDGDGYPATAPLDSSPDCNDVNAAINPGATENILTTGVDEDCDGNPLG